MLDHRGIDRRSFLGMLLAQGAHLALPSLGAAKDYPDLVAVTGSDPGLCAREAVEILGGMQRFVSKNDIVFCKPNMYFFQPHNWGTTTDRRIIRAVTGMALNAGARKVTMADKFYHGTRLPGDRLGLRSTLAGLQDSVFSLLHGDEAYWTIPIPDGIWLKEWGVARQVLNADVLINLPVAKSHNLTHVSFGMKNWMGVVKNPIRWHENREAKLQQAIADINTVLKPKLTVMDLSRGLLTNGPGGPGKFARLNMVVAGTDPVALDAFALNLAAWNGQRKLPSEIIHIARAAQNGVGTYNFSDIDIKKKSID